MTDIVQKTVGANALYVIDESNNTLVVDQTNGRVGINNTSPGYNLAITGATHTSANLSAGTDLFLVDEGNSRVSVGTTTGVAGFAFNVAGNTTLVGDVLTGTAMKWVNSTGRLGIGTTVPLHPLDVRGADDNDISIIGSGSIGVQNSAEVTPPSNRAWGFLSIDTGSTMVGGNIRLDDGVTGGTHPGYEAGTEDRGGAGITFTNANGATGQIAFIRKNDTNDDTWVVTESMRIDEDGKVGIGTNNPSSTLHVSTADNIVAKFLSTDATASIELADNSTTNNAALTRVGQTLTLCANGGNVAIGNSISSYNGSAPAAGQLLIGDATAGVWDAATLTAGSNITITNADGAITIAASGGGGGGSPGGNQFNVQINDGAGAFIGDDDFAYDTSSATVAIGQSRGSTTLIQDGDFTIGTGGTNRIAGRSLEVQTPIIGIGTSLNDQLSFFGGAPIAGNAVPPVGDPAPLPFADPVAQAWCAALYAALGPAGFNIIQQI